MTQATDTKQHALDPAVTSSGPVRPVSDTHVTHHLNPQPLIDPLVHVTRETISWKRKVFHMAGIGSVALIYALSGVKADLAPWILGGFALIFCSMDALRFAIPALHRQVRRDFGFCMRDYELRGLTGSSWFLLGGTLTVALFSKEAAVVGFLCLAVGDPLASWVGIRYGQVRLPGGKSLEGSLTFLAASAVVSLAYLAVATAGTPGLLAVAGVSLAAAAAAAFAEWLTGPVRLFDDNFLVPILSAAAVSACLGIAL